MSIKTYQNLKLVLTVVLAIIFSQAFIFNSYIIPISALVIVVLILMILRRRVVGVLADERDQALAGRAALIAVQIYSWLAVVIMMILYASRKLDPAYSPIAMTLAFSSCFLMFLYSLVFRFHRGDKPLSTKAAAIFFSIALLVAAGIVLARFLVRG